MSPHGFPYEHPLVRGSRRFSSGRVSRGPDSNLLLGASCFLQKGGCDLWGQGRAPFSDTEPQDKRHLGQWPRGQDPRAERTQPPERRRPSSPATPAWPLGSGRTVSAAQRRQHLLGPDSPGGGSVVILGGWLFVVHTEVHWACPPRESGRWEPLAQAGGT